MHYYPAWLLKSILLLKNMNQITIEMCFQGSVEFYRFMTSSKAGISILLSGLTAILLSFYRIITGRRERKREGCDRQSAAQTSGRGRTSW